MENQRENKEAIRPVMNEDDQNSAPKREGRAHDGKFAAGNRASIGVNPNKRARNFLSQRLISKLNEKVKGDPRKMTWAEKIIEAGFKAAVDGSAPHFTAIFDRVEGKVKQSLDLTGSGSGGAVVIETVIVDPKK